MNPYLSVIIPAYNEEKRITKNLKAISSYLERQPYSYEIIVVNDGSKDNTADVVRDLGLSIKNLKLIDRKENKGKGFTVREGMLIAQGKIRLFTDADNSTDISYFDKMRPFFDKGYDIVISSRDSKDAIGAGQAIKQPWYKRLLGNLGNIYIQILVLPGIWDTQNGFKAFRDYAAEKIFKISRINRWSFDVEILALAKKFNYKMAIIPVVWKNDPNSHVSLFSYFRTLFEVLKIAYYIRFNKYNYDDKKE